MTRACSRPRAVVAAIVLVAATAAGSASALAQFGGSTAAQSHTLASGVLQPPTAPGTAHGPCTPALSSSIVVSWSATASTWAAGYIVSRATAAAGPYVDIATVSGRGATTYLNSPLPFSTTFHYRVRAIKAAWSSTPTATVSRTTKTLLCL